ncbi:phosphoglycerate mutase-like protein [Clathrospora elynae]|uniref:Phosphoglycerate mutase-like protein n=1 Tax=Clathrospora elynae TaxID=706981 RepID=A0A6A5SXE5_9PLEO|nr:phosphoglycerate mutase-like protein [Clathrospora elynae]
MSGRTWEYIARRGFFSHDEDPESWEFRATTRTGLGILNRAYPTDADFDPKYQRSQWERLRHYVQSLNQEDPETKRYKIIFLVRHGQGLHNVKEKEVGRKEWDRYWAKLPGDGTTTWLDAELTPTGEQQARDIAKFWASENLPLPGSVYSSPLRRCLRTTTLAFAPVLNAVPKRVQTTKEKLRERLGVHTCDQRSSKTWIANTYPNFEIEDGFTEEDELWQPNRRETFEEHVLRKTELLDDVFANDDNELISMTAHSGAIMALFAATGWKKIPVAAGAVYPLLVCATRTQAE